ncbi:hypothetical protein [uncultured Cyclobacterium sp.]|uniref:hypothetical protein n=1 Tax=uncultured Cyclobacterium sp. TaxID=453820 RepID=UPI0030ED1A62|tara:strand:+ start:10695 stop:10976 length:282 start_codon:yes stop_codon:yes gene_type:complete
MEAWKNKIMDSLQGMEEVHPPKDSLLAIKKKLADQKRSKMAKNPRQWMAVAAVMLLLVCANVFVLNNYFTYQESTEQVESAYTGLITNYNIYD